MNTIAKGIQDYVNSLDLPDSQKRRSKGERSLPARDVKLDILEESKKQAMVVGADIVSFALGTPRDLRKYIVNCALLAQLAANRRVPARKEIRKWYDAYFDVLDHIGWVVQERAFSTHNEKGDNFEAHQAILSVASVVLGPASTALAVVTSTLTAMKSMSNGPWMTVFRQESQTARAGRFQVTVVEPGASNDGVMISLMAFELNAQVKLTQVLFFKYRSSDVTLHHASGKITIDASALSAAGDSIAKRVADYVQDFVENVPI